MHISSVEFERRKLDGLGYNQRLFLLLSWIISASYKNKMTGLSTQILSLLILTTILTISYAAPYEGSLQELSDAMIALKQFTNEVWNFEYFVKI